MFAGSAEASFSSLRHTNPHPLQNPAVEHYLMLHPCQHVSDIYIEFDVIKDQL